MHVGKTTICMTLHNVLLDSRFVAENRRQEHILEIAPLSSDSYLPTYLGPESQASKVPYLLAGNYLEGPKGYFKMVLASYAEIPCMFLQKK